MTRWWIVNIRLSGNAAEQYRGIFCRKMQKMSDLLTFNTGAAEIYANVKKNNTFIKIGGRMKIYTYQGKKNVSGEKIRQMRNMKRMSQSALAAKMQVEGVMLERDSISRIEGGERFVADYELRVFAKVLGVDVKWLLNEQ